MYKPTTLSDRQVVNVGISKLLLVATLLCGQCVTSARVPAARRQIRRHPRAQHIGLTDYHPFPLKIIIKSMTTQVRGASVCQHKRFYKMDMGGSPHCPRVLPRGQNGSSAKTTSATGRNEIGEDREGEGAGAAAKRTQWKPLD
jgi:hypothetical protein